MADTPDSSTTPNPQTLVQLGRAVWFTLVSAQRATAVPHLEERLASLADGEIRRHRWSDQEWLQFLLNSWEQEAKELFSSSGEADESELIELFQTYLNHYQQLTAADNKEHADTVTMFTTVQQKLQDSLSRFHQKLGDPLRMCQVCGQGALGRRLLRCSRCKRAFYCSVDCQKQDWPRHKATCTNTGAETTRNPREVDRLVRLRYRELRRQGQTVQSAMQTARAEYGVDDAQEQPTAGAQVAAMFGMPM